MIIRTLFASVLCMIFLSSSVFQTQAVSPYNILGLKRTATDEEVQAKYKKLRSKHRRNKVRKNMVTQAYNQIKVQRSFQTQPPAFIEQPRLTEPQHIDQTYVYGYKLNDQFDDGSYFRANLNQTQHILERAQHSEQNKKTARMLLFVGSMFLKLLPCIIIYCLCRGRGRGEGGLSDVMARAGNGYANFGRRLRQPR